MTGLKAIHDSLDEIPEAYRELYTEKDGKFELTGIAGIRTQADVDRVQEALRKKTNDLKETKQQLSVWGDWKHDEIQSQLDRIPELEAASQGKLDEAALEEMAERRSQGMLKSRIAPVERRVKELERNLGEVTAERDTLKAKHISGIIHGDMRKAGLAAKMRPEAIDDMLLYDRLFEVTEDGKTVTRDQVGVTPGLDPMTWLTEQQDKKPHWWPDSVGGGAGGANARPGALGGENPWSESGWSLQKQGEFFRKYGREKAEEMARKAGSRIGATKPTKRQSA